MKISHPTLSMENSMRILWKEVFHDSDEYIELFFSKQFDPSHSLVAHHDGIVLSMLFALPVELVSNNVRMQARYVYAVGTLPQHQKKGLSGLLMEGMHGWLQGMGVDASVLVPANPDLFHFYRKRGYQTEFFVDEKEVVVSETKKSIVLKKTTLADQHDLRNKYFSKSRLFAKWSLDALKYRDNENSFLHGEVLAFDFPYKGYAVCVPIKEKVFIKEIISGTHDALVFNAISAHFGVKKLMVRKPGQKHSKPFGMIKWYNNTLIKEYDKKPAYLGLALD